MTGQFINKPKILALLFAMTGFGTMTLANETPVKADNTKVNQRDTRPGEKTPEDQSLAASDVEVTQKIRRSITDDSSLSSYAHNIKIVTVNGKVTLKGPVKSSAEKGKVIALAKTVAGDANVTSEIAIAK